MEAFDDVDELYGRFEKETADGDSADIDLGGTQTMLSQWEELDMIGQLQRAWVNEKLAPEILQFETELVGDLLHQCETQEEAMSSDLTKVEDMFPAFLYQMEITRVKYLLKEYLRTRIYKIERFLLHIMTDERTQTRLSREEMTFAKELSEANYKHIEQSGMLRIPENLRSLTTGSSAEFIPRPNLDHFIYCRILQDCGDVRISEGGDDVVTLNAGSIFGLKYRVIRDLLQERKVELL